MNNLSIWLLIIAFLSLYVNCKHNDSNQKCVQLFDIKQYKKECIPVDSVTINGVVPFLMTKEQFSQVFRKADSVIVAPSLFHARLPFNDSTPKDCFYHFIGQSVFVSRGDYIHPVILDLGSTPITLNYKQIEISRKTGSSYIFKLFPMSTRLRKGIEGNAFGGVVTIDATDWNGGSFLWFLLFQGGHISKIVFYTMPQFPLSEIPFSER